MNDSQKQYQKMNNLEYSIDTQLSENIGQNRYSVNFDFLEMYHQKDISQYENVCKETDNVNPNTGIEQKKIQFGNTGIYLIRSEFTFRGVPVNDIINTLMNPDYKKLTCSAKKECSVIEDYQCIDNISENNKIHYMNIKMPMWWTDRELLTQIGYTQRGENTLFVENSIGMDNIPITDNKIRASFHKAIYLTPVKGSQDTKCIFYDYCNMNGSLPKWLLNVINYFTVKQNILNLYELCIEEQEKRKKYELNL